MSAWLHALSTAALSPLSAAQTHLFLLGLLALAATGTLRLTARRTRRIRRLLAERAQGWQARIAQARARHASLITDPDLKLVALAGSEGQTGELLGASCRELDDLYLRLCAMEQHVSRCAAASWRRIVLGRSARTLAAMERPFSFDTANIAREPLFNVPPARVDVLPAVLLTDLEWRFDAIQQAMDRLHAASDARSQPASALLPRQGLDRMIEMANAADLPLRWLDDHPLFGEAGASTEAWIEANRIRDPLACWEGILCLRAREQAVTERFDALMLAVSAVAALRLRELPNTGAVVLGPDHDLRALLARARMADTVFAAQLGLEADSKNVRAIQQGAAEVVAAWRAVHTRAAEIQGDLSMLPARIAAADRARASFAELNKRTAAAVLLAESTHRRARDARDLLDAAPYTSAQAQSALERARQLRSAGKLLEAGDSALEATRLYSEASRQVWEALSLCVALDEERRSYESARAAAISAYDGAVNRMRQYDSNTERIKPVPAARFSGAVDYAEALGQLQALLRGWEDAIATARLRHLQEQGRRRKEERREIRTGRPGQAAPRAATRGRSPSLRLAGRNNSGPVSGRHNSLDFGNN